MRKPSAEKVPYMPDRSRYCTLGEIVVYHDTARFNGQWYALVPVRAQGGPEIGIEIMLNGGGHSKAREKITRELTARGYYGFNIAIADGFKEIKRN